MNERPDSPTYRIEVAGHLDKGWAVRFEGMRLTAGTSNEGQPITTISGPVQDQSALHGVLARIRDLGLEILKVELTEPDPGTASG